MAPNSNFMPEHNMYDSLLQNWESFIPDNTLDFPFQGSMDTSPSNPGNAPPTLSPQINPGGNSQVYPQGLVDCDNHRSNKSVPLPSKPSYKCSWPNCDKEPYAHKTTLTRHYQFDHVAPGSFECDICDLTFNRKDHLKQHERTKVHKKNMEKS